MGHQSKTSRPKEKKLKSCSTILELLVNMRCSSPYWIMRSRCVFSWHSHPDHGHLLFHNPFVLIQLQKARLRTDLCNLSRSFQHAGGRRPKGGEATQSAQPQKFAADEDPGPLKNDEGRTRDPHLHSVSDLWQIHLDEGTWIKVGAATNRH